MSKRKHDVTFSHGQDEYGPHYTWACTCGSGSTAREKFKAMNDREGRDHAAGRGTVTDAGFSAEVPIAYRGVL